MELYEIITRFAALSGLTFDEALVIMMFHLLALWGGVIFMISLFFDLGRCLYRIIKELFLLFLYKLRRKGEKEP